MSAAVDGLRVAEAIIASYENKETKRTARKGRPFSFYAKSFASPRPP